MTPVLVLLLVAMSGTPAADGARVRVSAAVDRPAVWIADRVTYTVRIACPPGVDVLTEDLDRDRLKLTGLEVVSADRRRVDDGGGVRYTFAYVLTTHRADVDPLVVGSFPIRYFLTRPGLRPEDAAPAGTVAVPAVAIPFRSLLPDDRAGYEAREDRALPSSWVPYGALMPLGVGLIVVSAMPIALLIVDAVRRTRARRPTRSAPTARHIKQNARKALATLDADDATDARARREAFGRLDVLMRGYVADMTNVPARSMPPDRLIDALDRCSSQVPLRPLEAVLRACERARFAPPELQPSSDAWRATLAEAERIVSGE